MPNVFKSIATGLETGVYPTTAPVFRYLTRRSTTQFDACRNLYSDGTPPGADWYWASPENYSGTPWSNGGGLFEIDTPYGNGLKYRVIQDMQMEWNADAKGLMSEWQFNGAPSFLNKEHIWEGAIYLPSAGNPDGFDTGFSGIVLLQIANTTNNGTWGDTNGNMLVIFGDGRLGFSLRESNAQWADHHYGTASAVALDTWHTFRWETKHTYSSDGYNRCYINGVTIKDYSGPTLWDGEYPWSIVQQIYTTRWETTLQEVWFGNVRVTQL